MGKYAFRFYRQAWVDVIVEANDEEEAEELANEKYNNGEYDDSDEDWENTHTKNVTEEYNEFGW